jgi:hypothetical protein
MTATNDAQPEAGGRCGHVLLATNNQKQFTAVVGMLIALQIDDFLQDATQAALPAVNDVERYVAMT